MKSLIVKRPVQIAGRSTSVSIEDDFWSGLREIAKERKETLSQLISSINAERRHANLSSAIRLFILRHYRDQFRALEQRRAQVLPVGLPTDGIAYLEPAGSARP